MAIGDATVEPLMPERPLPKPVAYEPPDFVACVAHLQVRDGKSTTAQLTTKCKRTYEGIRARILGFLIAGYWLRGEADEENVSLSQADVKQVFDEEKRANYPTAASFRKLQEASGQTIPDLMFAVETQMLSAKLLEKFTKAHEKGKSERAKIAAFNRSIEGKWIGRTDCRPGYVVKDCSQYK
jgi:hypothetical protein